MNSLVKVIGEIVLTILIIFIPMLTVFSFYSDWLDSTRFILIMLTAADFILVATMVDKLTGKSTH